VSNGMMIWWWYTSIYKEYRFGAVCTLYVRIHCSVWTVFVSISICLMKPQYFTSFDTCMMHSLLTLRLKLIAFVKSIIMWNVSFQLLSFYNTMKCRWYIILKNWANEQRVRNTYIDFLQSVFDFWSNYFYCTIQNE